MLFYNIPISHFSYIFSETSNRIVFMLAVIVFVVGKLCLRCFCLFVTMDVKIFHIILFFQNNANEISECIFPKISRF